MSKIENSKKLSLQKFYILYNKLKRVLKETKNINFIKVKKLNYKCSAF